MLTEFQKQIYNIHLASYKKRQKKPYKLRENFEGFEQEHPEETLTLMRLERFFQNYSGINPKLFFNAPYIVHEDLEYKNLHYYNSQAAIKSYNLYLKLIEAATPDSDFQLEYINDSLKFIRDFCIEHKITLVNYMYFKEGITYSWAVHLAQHKVSFFVILGFCIFNIPIHDHIYDMPEDELDMLLGDLPKNYAQFKDQLETSTKARSYVFNGLRLIEKDINDHLQSK
jgi:hypothetical protein